MSQSGSHGLIHNGLSKKGLAQPVSLFGESEIL